MVSIKVRSYVVLGIDDECLGCNRGANHARERIGQQCATEPLTLEPLINGKKPYISRGAVVS